jgi:MerR family copper efflux transcriptional regulator
MSDADPAAPAMLHIGDVAEQVSLSLRTVRYYEEQGLIKPAGRTQGGFRLYTEKEVDRLLLIKQMKPLGFTVQQMCELLNARDERDHSDPERRADAERQLAGFALDAHERCDTLRRELQHAEQFARQLDDAPDAAL